MTSVQPTFRYREERYSDRYSESRPRDDRYDSYRRESSSSRLGLKISDDKINFQQNIELKRKSQQSKLQTIYNFAKIIFC